MREGSGTGEARASTPGQAHELALKGAETDATKRALATFGNPFGLALYDREQGGVSRRRGAKVAPALGPWILRAASGTDQAIFEKPSEFAAALQTAMSEAEDIELLFAIWEHNVETVRVVNRAMRQDQLSKSGIAPQLVAHLKRCAIALVKPAVDGSPDSQSSAASDQLLGGKPKIDKSVLTIGQPKRIRCKEHLRFVASQPCAICGRSPSHAHHVRHAQSRGLGLKVSDEFTVPLCATHHHQIHTTGKEREWWQQRNIDPLIIASALWQQSRDRHPTAGEDEASKDQSPGLDATQPQEQSPDVSRTQPPAKTMSGTAAFFHAMAPTLIANVLTVVFVYCFAVIGQQERSGDEEGRLTYLWLIVMVFMFMLYGLYTWGVYPLDKSKRSAASSHSDPNRRTRAPARCRFPGLLALTLPPPPSTSCHVLLGKKY